MKNLSRGAPYRSLNLRTRFAKERVRTIDQQLRILFHALRVGDIGSADMIFEDLREFSARRSPEKRESRGKRCRHLFRMARRMGWLEEDR